VLDVSFRWQGLQHGRFVDFVQSFSEELAFSEQWCAWREMSVSGIIEVGRIYITDTVWDSNGKLKRICWCTGAWQRPGVMCWNVTLEVTCTLVAGVCLTYKLQHNQAPSYLGPLVRVADVPGRRPLRSTNTDCLVVPHVRLSSVGNRAFPVAAPCVWNSLPHKVTSAQSLYSFQRHLKTFLFQRSFQDVIVTL